MATTRDLRGSTSGARARERVFNVRRDVEPGAVPGTIVTDPRAPTPKLRVMVYGPDQIDEQELTNVDELASWVGRPGVTWVSVEGLGDEDVLRHLGEVFDLHRLVLEDIVNVHQRAKAEEYEDVIFIVSRLRSRESIGDEQFSLVLTKNAVVSFQERPGGCIDSVRRRLREGKGFIRRKGADYLAYAILDAIVDAYFPVLESYGEELEAMEDEVELGSDASTITKLHHIKRELVLVRRGVWQMREMLGTLLRDEADLISDNTRVYLRDCYDHVLHVLEIVENYREVASGLVDTHLSLASNRMNEVMKVLTIIATIFIPLTFIAGIYGMNFNNEKSPWNMPELNWYFGYPLCLTLMIGTTGAMFWYFRQLGWIGSARNGGR